MSDSLLLTATPDTISSPTVIGDDSAMPDHRRSPTVRRRQLGTLLRQLRESKGLTIDEVAKGLGWSTGKLRYLEDKKSLRPNPRDVMDLLDVYEVTDERQRKFADMLAREAKERGWWHAYKDQLSETYTTYVGLEAGASAALNFEQGMIAGLLQTEAYADALIRAVADHADDKTVSDRVEVRLKRQDQLQQPDALRLWVVMDETALRREVGGSTIMREQMRHLLEVAELPNVNIQVVRFSAGAHAGVRGPFVILRFPEPDDLPAVYVDTVAGELFLDDAPDVQRFSDAFQKLVAVADSPSDTLALIAEAANQ